MLIIFWNLIHFDLCLSSVTDFSKINALVVSFQQILEGPIEILLCELVNDLHHSLFHFLNCLITTASELWE